MHALAAELFPICRSITGDGLRATLRRIQQEIPISIHEVPSGTPVLDWTVPDEWNIRDAWLENPCGERIVDFRAHNLHVVNYSVPVRARLGFDELKPHLHSLSEHPDWIPYRTSYYRQDWGFCLAHRQREQLKPGDYEVCIDATLAPGALSYGELLIAGETADEFLISVHCCHPSLANDNLSGLAVAVALARILGGEHAGKRRSSFRFLFIPGTIGAITWLARNEDKLARIRNGLVLTCLGDSANFTYKKSRQGHAPIDRAAGDVLRDSGKAPRVIDFFPYGYDERQYCSPGFDLPVGCLMRSQHGTFPEYHTSADDLTFIHPKALAESLDVLTRIVKTVESDREMRNVKREMLPRVAANSRFTPHGSRSFLNLKPKGEPQLGKYGLYETFHGDMMPVLWLLNLSDGLHSLADIAQRSGIRFDKLLRAADALLTRGLLKEVEP